MNNQSWDDQVKAINAQHRFERLQAISRDLYRTLFNYQNPGYQWTCNEYGEMFKTINKLSREYDGHDWASSELLDGHWKTRQVVQKANLEWAEVQKGIII